MDAREEIQNLRREVIEHRTNAEYFCARTLMVLDLADERVRHAEAEAAERRLNIRTEEEVAQQLGCSVDTVKRVRQKHGIPHTLAGIRIRYTDEQFRALLKAMEKPVQLKAVKSKAS
jgi:hypothetical protein